MPPLSRSEIEARARARFGEPNRGLSSRHELRFGHHGSVAVQLTGDKAGLWYDFETLDGHTLLATTERAALPRLERARFAHSTDSAAWLEKVRRTARAVHATPAELYLLKRGITAPPPPSIRFCPSPHSLCGLAQAIDGSIKAIQLVYVTDDGRTPPNLKIKKRTYTACSHWHEIAAVRMPGRGEPILCEGIETGLSIWTSLEPRRPVLACLGLAGIKALRIAASRVTIARDGDLPDSPADKAIQAAVLARRRRGQRVKLAFPPPGLDFNDVLRRSGSSAIKEAIQNAHE